MLHFEGQSNIHDQTPPPPSYAQSNTPQRSPPTSLMEELNALAAQPQDLAPRVNSTPPVYTTQRGTAFSIMQAVLFSPFNLGYKMFNTLLYFLSWIFPFFPRLTGYYPANRTATRSVPEITDPKTIAERCIRTFEERYGENELKFFKGGYTDALDEAKKNLKYLVVILQSEEHDLTTNFNEQVVLNRQVVELLNRPDIVLWMGDVKESEAYQVACGLEVSKFPFCALIAPSPKTPTSNVLVMTVLIKLSGGTGVETFVSTIEEKMEVHQPKLLSLVLDKQERDLSRRLREEQDSAYERSLAVDRERELQQLRERERIQLQQEEEQQVRDRQEREQRLEKERKKNLEKLQLQWKKWTAWTIKQNETAISSEGRNSARISLRLLSGERVVHKFDGDDSVEDVYAFVECYDILKDLESNEPEPEKPEPGYMHKYPFELVSPMPRKVLVASQQDRIKDEKSLWPNGSLVVEFED